MDMTVFFQVNTSSFDCIFAAMKDLVNFAKMIYDETKVCKYF